MRVQVNASPGELSYNATMLPEEMRVLLKSLYTMGAVGNAKDEQEDDLCGELIMKLNGLLG